MHNRKMNCHAVPVAVGDNIVHPADLASALVTELSVLDQVAAIFPMKLNPYLLSLIQRADDPIGRQVIPDPQELNDQAGSTDPLGEEHQSPAPRIIHRYPNRVVFLASDQCAVHCRFCMRKRRVADGRQVSLFQIEQGLSYIRERSHINEVILSGGDPLMLDDARLTAILRALRDIPHVRLLRIHTRMPGVMPQRITQTLAAQLSAFHPLHINIHFNHPAELTPPAETACGLLADAGIPLGSQTVLLKGVNDQPEVLHALFETLLTMRVRPYYLHQLDPVPGTAHFRVPLEEGLALMGRLRGRLSGMARPHFMVDLPGGGGKIALTPDAVVEKAEAFWLLKNWEGKVFAYPSV